MQRTCMDFEIGEEVLDELRKEGFCLGPNSDVSIVPMDESGSWKVQGIRTDEPRQLLMFEALEKIVSRLNASLKCSHRIAAKSNEIQDRIWDRFRVLGGGSIALGFEHPRRVPRVGNSCNWDCAIGVFADDGVAESRMREAIAWAKEQFDLLPSDYQEAA